MATRWGSSPKARVCTIGFSGSTSRSATGANTQLIPTARASCAVTAPAHRATAGIAQRGERERRRELGEPFHLLTRAALEIRGEEQRPLGAAQEIGGEPAHALDVAAEDDEPAHAEIQRVGDGAGLVARSCRWAPRGARGESAGRARARRASGGSDRAEHPRARGAGRGGDVARAVRAG